MAVSAFIELSVFTYIAGATAEGLTTVRCFDTVNGKQSCSKAAEAWKLCL
jgi:pyruvate/oxaloacetate carboxyltransferase